MEQNNFWDKVSKLTKKTILYLSVLLCLLISLCYWLRPDSFTLITFFPAGFWIIPGVIMIGLGWSRHNKYIGLIAIIFWLLYLAIFVEETQSLARFGVWTSPTLQTEVKNNTSLRIISLNCGGGNIKAVKEIIKYEPDIVLLQESPSAQKLEFLATELFGENAEIVIGVDTSVITRGKIENISQFKSSSITQTSIRLNSGVEIEVISTRLSPPLFWLNLFSPRCWKAHKEDRKLRYQEARKIAERIELIPANIPIIIGGDFNMPAGDAPLRLLKPRLRDAFKEAGKGWGNTVINETPLARIDQIWISRHFNAITVVAKKTINSDHRMVICDIVIAN